ncbi:OsmC family protein [Natrinema longum]|uniref:OsmC family protein n=1 Tax=Natrinema longum TaxID=370324 RepID=A0A8A2U684_9EURY|nr:OsmC family protein [Natrinema longum]MBZ6494759.1 OsmC family protein [Natrinema longum]QSW83932.1 OsmC family protein [Natrinema longum]
MTDTQQTAHGTDLETLEGFAEHAAENPEAVQLGLRASATYEGTAAHSLAKIDSYDLGGETITRETREYTIPYGGWKEVLDAGGWIGATDRMEPIEVALSALAACINVGISINAAASGVDIDHLETRVGTDFDPAVLFSLEELKAADSVFENLTAEVEIDGEGLDRDLIDEWARRAPVYALVSLAQDVDLTINTPAEVAGDDYPVTTDE